MSISFVNSLKDYAKVFKFVTIPLLAVIIGSIIGFREKVSPNVLSDFQHLVAGIVIAAVGSELIPELSDAETRNERIGIIIGFAAGAVVMVLSRYLLEKNRRKVVAAAQELQEMRLSGIPSQKPSTPWGLYISSMIDIFIDGLLIGIGFGTVTGQPIASRKDLVFGIVLAIGLGIEGFFLTFSTNATMVEFQSPKWAIYLAPVFYALGTLLGTFGGVTVVANLQKTSPGAYHGILGFGVSALIWLAVSLLIRSHPHGITESWLKPTLLFVGFIGIVIINWAAKFFAK
jgi:ZIP family zinc transporter